MTVENAQTLNGFRFKMSSDRQCYILIPNEDDKYLNPKRYTNAGWQLIEGHKPIIFRDVGFRVP